MKNLLVSLLGLTFCAALSTSIFAGNRKTQQLARVSKDNPDLLNTMSTSSPAAKNSALQTFTTKIIQAGDYEIQQLATISSDDGPMAFIMSATISKDSRRMEKILIDSYDRGNFLGRKSLEMESFLQNGFTQTLHEAEILSIRPIGFGPEDGGLLELQYLEDSWRNSYASVNFSLLRNKDDGVWMLINEDGQRTDTIKAIVDRKYSSDQPLPKLAKISPSGPTKNPALQIPVTTKIRYDYDISSIVLELSSEGEIHAINFDMYDNLLRHYGKHRKRYIPLKNLFEENFGSPILYYDNIPTQISPISLHPLDFNPKDGGTFAIRYTNRRFLRPSKTVEVIVSLIKNKGEWFLADEEGRPMKELFIKTTIGHFAVRKIIADEETSAQRKLKIRPCKESVRALLL